MPTPKRPSRVARFLRRRPRVAVSIAVGGGLLIALGAYLVWRRPSRPSPAPPVRVVEVTTPAERPTRVIAFAEGCVTARCHAGMKDAPVVHPPTAQGACQVCHQPDAGGHKFPLVAPRRSLCKDCHETGQSRRFQHQAMSEDGCIACHDPHTSPRRGLLAADTEEKTCARCHPASDGTLRHKPYAEGRCTSCHDPHESESPALLRGGDVEGNCRLCHAPTVASFAGATKSHEKVEGSCVSCHGAHTANWKGLLKREPREACVGCHEDVGQAMAGAQVSHDAILKGDECVFCHDPHASRDPRMLRADQPTLCLKCHSKPVVASEGRTIAAMSGGLGAAGLVHGPVSMGQCSACHSVHGATFAGLLKAISNDTMGSRVDAANYTLCFSCHDKGMLDVTSAAATQFRDGNTNLHRSHLLAGAGKFRGCAACHSAHAADGPRLIAKEVPFQGSTWMMPMNFELAPDGGTCSSGCHEAISYSRMPGGIKLRGGGP